MTATAKIISMHHGGSHGSIARLISPDALGRELKPFVLLDRFDGEVYPGSGFPLHPHSGIATLTWQPDTDVAYADTTGQSGVLKAGGIEWMNAGGGAWHKATFLKKGRAKGFQLWVAMPPSVENGPSEGRYLPPDAVAECAIEGGDVKVLLGEIEFGENRVTSPIVSHQDMNYLVVTLEATACWTYLRPDHHNVAFAVASLGEPQINGVSLKDQLVVMEERGAITISSGLKPVQVLIGSALKHQHPLVLGSGSVHTSEKALAAGEQLIHSIGLHLQSGR